MRELARRRFAQGVAAAVAGILAGSRLRADEPSASPEASRPRHVCQGLNQCKGQGGCAHGCSGHGCQGKNDCKGKGGCAAAVAKHKCAGSNSCKGFGGCAKGDKGCAGLNTCKGKGGCEVPLKIEHARMRKEKAAKAS